MAETMENFLSNTKHQSRLESFVFAHPGRTTQAAVIADEHTSAGLALVILQHPVQPAYCNDTELTTIILEVSVAMTNGVIGVVEGYIINFIILLQARVVSHIALVTIKDRKW